MSAVDDFESLRRTASFILRWDFGRRELRGGRIEAAGLNLFRVIPDLLSARGQEGAWSLAHHAHHGDFLAALRAALKGAADSGRLDALAARAAVAERAGDGAGLLALQREAFELAREFQGEALLACRESVLSHLRAAAGGFVKRVEGRIQIWASSLDWFQQEWGRDTFISLPGLLLATGRLAEAREIVANFAAAERGGLIPNRIPDPARPDDAEYNAADAPLWFVDACRRLDEADPRAGTELLPVLRRIIGAYEKGTSFRRLGEQCAVRMDEDGLVIGPAQATWMDAQPDHAAPPVTPRDGKAVEINALWHAALRFVAGLEIRGGDRAAGKRLAGLADRVRHSFNARFWIEGEERLADVVDGDPRGAAARPNMIFALSHGSDLLPPARRAAVLERVRRDLLTPFGLRTLSPNDPAYRGRYETEKPPREKDLAYHQGTAWPWLIGPYADAVAIVGRDSGRGAGSVRAEIAQTLAPLAAFAIASPLKTLPEVYDGDAPYRPGGTRSQAWSVAELLRALTEHL